MTEDTRRFRSTDEMMNAVFGSVPLSDEERRAREASHRAAQVPVPLPKEEPKRPGYLPRGVMTNATANLAFREKDFKRLAGITTTTNVLSARSTL